MKQLNATIFKAIGASYNSENSDILAILRPLLKPIRLINIARILWNELSSFTEVKLGEYENPKKWEIKCYFFLNLPKQVL